MINSLLVHLNSAQCATEVLNLGIGIASRWKARIRGLSLLDTRRLETLTISCESALGCANELERLDRLDADQEAERPQMTSLLNNCGLSFDLRRMRGDPLRLLQVEARFHDVTLTLLQPQEAAASTDTDLSVGDLLKLVNNGVQPLLILRPGCAVRRVLLVSDGSRASAVSIRQFLAQRLFPDVELRLLALGKSSEQAQAQLHELVEYARQLELEIESGWLQGTPHQVLLRYAKKWDADLVVTGVARQLPILKPLWQQPIERLLQNSNIGAYLMT